MIIYFHKICCSILLLYCFYAHSTPENIIVNPVEEQLHGQYELLIDSSNTLTLELILSGTIQRFFKAIPDEKKITTKGVTYWLRFTLSNKLDQNLVLECIKHYSLVELYHQDASGSFKKLIADKYNHLFGREYYVIPYSTTPRLFYLKIQSPIATGLGFYILSADYAYNQSTIKMTQISILFGILLIVLIYNFVFWIRLRIIAFAFYSNYLLCLIIFYLAINGFFNPLFRNITFDYVYITIPYVAMTISLLAYSSNMLMLRKKDPFLYNLIKWTIILRLIIFLFGWIFNLEEFHNPKIDTIILLPALYAAFGKMRDGSKPARYLTISLLLIFIGYFVRSIISSTQILFEVFNVDTFFLIFNTLEILFLSFAITERFLEIKREKEFHHQNVIKYQKQIIESARDKEILQKKMNDELELLVDERTHQLKEAHETLVVQAEEIKRMNDLLKEDNQRLVENVELLKNARLLDVNLSFDEFKQTFTDEAYCLKFMAGLKWKNGFECRKCSFKKYYEINSYSRKCKVCRYIESPIAHTLLENIKFPLDKALYIVFIGFTKRDINITQFAQTLGLRTGTCFNFYKKVLGVIDSQKKKPEDWISILYHH